MNTTKKLGSKLKLLREVHNFTQEYVANVLDVSPSTYFLMEKGQAQLTIDRIEKLATLYKMDLVDILKLNDHTIIQQNFTHSTSTGVTENVIINNGLAEEEKLIYKETIKRLEEQNDKLMLLIEKLSNKI